MNVTVHLPNTLEGMQELQNAICKLYANAVIEYVRNLSCSVEQKEQLITDVLRIKTEQ